MDKVVLVTGATSGIGADAVQYISESGYSVVIVGRNEEKLQQTRNSLQAKCVAFYNVDLTDIEQIQSMFSKIREDGIVLDGMVHCAGVDTTSIPTRSIKNESISRLMHIHTESFIEMCKLFYKRDISKEGSSIVAISSLAAIMCQRNTLDYSVSKAALNAAVKVISKEFLKRNIRVNAILPANVDTPMCDNLKKLGEITSIQPMGFIEPRQVSYMIEYLLSEKAKYITGGLIPISAGMEY